MSMLVNNNYDSLKNRFLKGIEYYNSLSTYCKNTRVPSKVLNDSSYFISVTNLYNNILQCKKMNPDTLILYPDVDMIRKKALKENCLKFLHSSGPAIIPDTMKSGMNNPITCIIAWYDAIAEWIISEANSQIGKNTPIQAINEELDKLTKALSSNKNYLTARDNLIKKMKDLYPKTYKTRIKLCENNLNNKIQTAISDIVKQIVKG